MTADRALDDARRRIEQQREVARRTADPREQAELAIMLNNLSADLWDRQRVSEALVPVGEAIGIWRQLVEQDPVRWRPELARSLRNQARFLATLGRTEDAVATQRELTGQLRLAAMQDLRQMPALGEAFDHLGGMLAHLGRSDDAVLALERKVEVFIELSTLDAARVGPHLATALSTLGVAFGDLGRHDDAVHAARQAIEIFRSCRANLDSQQEIAMALRDIGALHETAGADEAMAAAARLGRRYPHLSLVDQVIRIDPRGPAQQQITAIDGGLAGALCLLGEELAQLGQFDAALEPAEEAVTILRRLTHSHPDDFGPWLARALDSMATTLTALGRHDAAMVVREERQTVPGQSSPS